MKVVDLFCGCGGLSLGFEKAGMDVVAGFDNWLDALDVYRRNFTHPAIRADLSNVCGEDSSVRTGYDNRRSSVSGFLVSRKTQRR